MKNSRHQNTPLVFTVDYTQHGSEYVTSIETTDREAAEHQFRRDNPQATNISVT